MLDIVYMDDVRERLITAGVELLEQDGLAALTQRRITLHAGVSHGAPRHHFPTYAGLLAAIAGVGLDELDHDVSACLTVPDPRRAVSEACNAVIGYAVAHPAMFELFGRHDLLDGAGGELRRYPSSWLAALTRRMQEAQPDAGEQHAIALWAAVQGLGTMVGRRSVEAISTSAIAPEAVIKTLVSSLIK